MKNIGSLFFVILFKMLEAFWTVYPTVSSSAEPIFSNGVDGCSIRMSVWKGLSF